MQPERQKDPAHDQPGTRPALRKAPDADIHPAQGQAASVITLKRAVDVPIEQSNTTQIDLRNRETADLRQVPVVTSTPVVNNDDHDTEGLETVAKKSKKGSSKLKARARRRTTRRKRKAVRARRKRASESNSAHGRTSGLTSQLRCRRPCVALRSGAKARGTSVEDRVDSVVNEPSPKMTGATSMRGSGFACAKIAARFVGATSLPFDIG